MHNIAQKQIFFFKLPEMDPDPDLVGIRQKGPDPTGSGSATLTGRQLLLLAHIILKKSCNLLVSLAEQLGNCVLFS
jgi:hypothetical protein